MIPPPTADDLKLKADTSYQSGERLTESWLRRTVAAEARVKELEHIVACMRDELGDAERD